MRKTAGEKLIITILLLGNQQLTFKNHFCFDYYFGIVFGIAHEADYYRSNSRPELIKLEIDCVRIRVELINASDRIVFYTGFESYRSEIGKSFIKVCRSLVRTK